ncbi:MAG TPA: RNA polymerase sigma factor [Candidatus Moranbacteria bacterium]|nr:RNA polymerase sigma factor [Candidatus Moranbacteria bacterium]
MMDKNKEIKTTKELSDNDLVEIIRKKNQERYSEIVERYQKKLFVYIYRLIGNREEAEDLLQDVFVKAYKNLNSYDTSRKFSSWIYRIAHNESVNYIKRKSLKKFISWETIVSTKDKLDSSSEEEGADKAWIRKEVSKEVNEAIGKLPFKYKQVLTLRYYSDQSYEEIAEILGRPVNTVGTLINRAKKKLAEEIKRR